MLPDATIQQLARELHDARLERRSVAPLTQSHPGLDLDAAYLIQHAGQALRERAGERVIGYKMGLTSKAKREQMNLLSPVYGVLTEPMQVADGGSFAVGAGIHPKIEPEIVFRLAQPLSGRVSFEEALAAVGEVGAAMEILDSRFIGFKYFSLPDVVADNSSSSHFVIASRLRAPSGLDLAALQMTLKVDGRVAQSAQSSAISGHPIESIVQLVEMLAAHGRALPAGSLVLAGAATVAEALAPGQRIQLEVEGLPSVSIQAS